ncbi:hypothetical protein O3P69_002233 [Scylla paramamosain]|uniref:Uncharacterized protein n=1 Tax=Scylla paramamosain TaxID=85552 RepID=A0AAW0V6G1_SCYPA
METARRHRWKVLALSAVIFLPSLLYCTSSSSSFSHIASGIDRLGRITHESSKVTQREVSAVEEWLASGKMFHVMRDHPYHSVPVLGGMWDARWDIDPALATKLRNLRDKMMAMAVGKRNYGLDQQIIKVCCDARIHRCVVMHPSQVCDAPPQVCCDALFHRCVVMHASTGVL